MLNYNVIPGKSIENRINRVHVKIVTTKKQTLNGSFRPTLKRENNFVMEQQLLKKKNVE